MAYTTDILNSIRDAELALGDATGLEDAMSYEALEEFLKDPRRKPESLEEILDAWREDDEQEMFEQITRAQNIARLKRQLDADAGPLTDEVERDNVERDNVERVVVGDSDMAAQHSPSSSLTQRDVPPRKMPEWAQRNVAAQLRLGLGASDTDVSDLGQDGALANILTDSESYKYYKALQDELYPEQAPRSKWEDALYFFLNMAAESSKPGATALGAAGEAGKATVDQMRELRKDQRAADLLKKRDLLSALAAERAAGRKAVDRTLHVNTETGERRHLSPADLDVLVREGKGHDWVPYKPPGAGASTERMISTMVNVADSLKNNVPVSDTDLAYAMAYATQLAKVQLVPVPQADGTTAYVQVGGQDYPAVIAATYGDDIAMQMFGRTSNQASADVATDIDDAAGGQAAPGATSMVNMMGVNTPY